MSDPTTVQRLKVAIRNVEDFRAQLKSTLETTRFNDRYIMELRKRLGEAYGEIVSIDVRYAVKHDVEQTLWKGVFYSTIDSYRSLMSSIPKHNRKRLCEVEEEFLDYLSDSIDFYQQRIQRMQTRCALKLTLGEFVRFNAAGRSWVSSAADTLKEEHLVLLSCHRCFLFMGDLARYREKFKVDDQWGNPPQRDWTNMKAFYNKAIKLLPIHGNAYNQFGVLAFDLNNVPSAVFYYCRALAVVQPFQNAKSNLFHALDVNAQMFAKMFPSMQAVHDSYLRTHEELMKRKPKDRSTRTHTQTGIASAVAKWLVAVIHIHFLLYRFLEGSAEDIIAICQYVCTELKWFLSIDSFDESLLPNLMVSHIFLVHFLALQVPPTANDVYDRVDLTSRPFAVIQISNPNVRLALSFVFEFAAACMTTRSKYWKRMICASLSMSWLAHHTQSLRLLGDSKFELTARSRLMKALSAFYNHVSRDEDRLARTTGVIDDDNFTSGSSSTGGGKVNTNFVPEDIEYFGFIPLAKTHQELSPHMCNILTAIGAVDNPKFRQIRILRIENACRAFCNLETPTNRKLLYWLSETGQFGVRDRKRDRRKKRTGIREAPNRDRTLCRHTSQEDSDEQSDWSSIDNLERSDSDVDEKTGKWTSNMDHDDLVDEIYDNDDYDLIHN